MDKVRELYRILNEEDRHVVPDQVEISLFRVEFHGKAPHISDRIRGASTSGHRGESREDRSDGRRVAQEFGPRQI